MDLSSESNVRRVAKVLDTNVIRAISLGALISACAARPAWYPIAPHVVRETAHDRFLVAGGEGAGGLREAACAAAHAQALAALVELLLRETEVRSDVVAAAGGPSRFHRSIHAFASVDSERAQRTREEYDAA